MVSELQTFRRAFAGIVGLACCLSVGGCDFSGLVPVHGQITFTGQPLPNATITFFPATGRPITASVSEGSYQIELIPTEYSIVVTAAVETPQGYGRKHWNQLPAQSVTLPEQFTSRLTTPLKADAAAIQLGIIDIDLR